MDYIVDKRTEEEFRYFKKVFNGKDIYKNFRDLYSNPYELLLESNLYRIPIKDLRYKIFLLINDIELLGKDMNEIKENVNAVLGDKLPSIFTDLVLQYSKYININKILDNIMSRTNENMELYDLDYFVKFFLMEFDRLKHDDIYVNDEFSKYVGKFYEVGYSLMKMEFICHGKSKIYECFLSSEYDSNIVSDLIFNEIDNLRRSMGYIEGLDLLEKRINESDSYLDKGVILALLFCSFPIRIREHIKLKLVNFQNEIVEIYNFLRYCYSIKFNIFKFLRFNDSGVTKYKEILKEYQIFLDYYSDFFDKYLETIHLKNDYISRSIKNHQFY